MVISMKKFIIILSVLFMPLNVFAYSDYIYRGGNTLGIMSTDSKALNYKYTQVNDADMIILVRKVEELSTDPNFVGYYDIEEARRQDIEDATETGLRIGREVGSKERNIEIAKSMLADKVSIEIISKYTNLSIADIKSLTL